MHALDQANRFACKVKVINKNILKQKLGAS